MYSTLDEESEIDQDEMKKKSIFNQMDEEEEEDDENNEFYNVCEWSRKEVNGIISSQGQPRQMNILRIASHLILFLVVLLGYINNFFNFNEADFLKNSLTSFRLSFHVMYNRHEILSNILDLSMMNIGILNQNQDSEEKLRSEIRSLLNELQENQVHTLLLILFKISLETPYQIGYESSFKAYHDRKKCPNVFLIRHLSIIQSE